MPIWLGGSSAAKLDAYSGVEYKRAMRFLNELSLFGLPRLEAMQSVVPVIRSNGATRASLTVIVEIPCRMGVV